MVENTYDFKRINLIVPSNKTYTDILDYQRIVFNTLLEECSGKPTQSTNYLICCEHEAVFTLGKNGKATHLINTSNTIPLVPIERGGDITYHGPGQWVLYPIFNLKKIGMGIALYVEKLEEVVLQTLLHFDIKGERIEGANGVWVKEKNQYNKIAAIGIKVSKGITMHGMAFNVSTNLNHFNHIIPCGITDKGVTSLEKVLGKKLLMEEVKKVLIDTFCKEFEMRITSTSTELTLV